jgi:hypothetical protein
MSYKSLADMDKQKNTAKILNKLYPSESLKEKFLTFFNTSALTMEYDLINLFLSNVNIN